MSNLTIGVRAPLRLGLVAVSLFIPAAAAVAQPSASVSPAVVDLTVPLNQPFTTRITAQGFGGTFQIRNGSTAPSLVTNIDPPYWTFEREAETKEFVVSGYASNVPGLTVSIVWFEYQRTTDQTIRINVHVRVRSTEGPTPTPTPTPTLGPTATPTRTPTPTPICADGCPVGIVPQSAGQCPSGAPLVQIRMDDEDRRNKNSRAGWTGALTTGRDPSETWLRFCEVNGTQFKPLGYADDVANHYAVLKMGAACPVGATEFTRKFDNEDRNNKNWSSGDISPNGFEASKTRLHFCLFKDGSEVMAGFPGLGIQYGVFAAPGFSRAVDAGWIHTDDEDTNNGNQFDGDAAGRAIIEPIDENSRINVARVTVETRPVARCSANPPSGSGSLGAEFSDAGSYARNGRSLASYYWSFSDGSTGMGPGPFWKWIHAPDTLTGWLTVTDDAGETSTTTCSATAYATCDMSPSVAGPRRVPGDCPIP